MLDNILFIGWADDIVQFIDGGSFRYQMLARTVCWSGLDIDIVDVVGLVNLLYIVEVLDNKILALLISLSVDLGTWFIFHIIDPLDERFEFLVLEPDFIILILDGE